jgi:hypothetical protein
MAELTGLAAVLDDLDPTSEGPMPEAEQLDLLGLPERRGGTELAPRKPGRPLGARNRRTQEWADYITRHYGNPLVGLAQLAMASVAELHVRLGCTPLEAMQEKRLAMIALLPYIAQRQPLAVDVTNRQVVYLNISDVSGGADPASAGAEMTITGALMEIVENQGLSEDGNGTV